MKHSKLSIIHTPSSVSLNDDIEKRERTGTFVAKLHNGEPCFEPPISISSISKNYDNCPIRYSDSQGQPALRAAIARKYNNSFSINNLIITHGAVGAINLALTTILNVGDEVIVIEPFWPQYAVLAELKNAKLVRAPINTSSGKVKAEELEALITDKTKLLILNNPVNPTGVVYSEQETAKIISLADKGIHILVDEVYGKYIYDTPNRPLVEQEIFQVFKDSIIYVNSFSKEYGLTGYRVGYCVLPDDMVTHALSISRNSMTCISPLNQMACTLALKKKKTFTRVFARNLLMLKKRKEKLEAELSRQKIPYIAAQGAFYLFIDLGSDSKPIVESLYHNFSIALVAGSDYGARFSNYLRVCYSTDDRSFETFMEYLRKEGFKEYRDATSKRVK